MLAPLTDQQYSVWTIFMTRQAVQHLAARCRPESIHFRAAHAEVGFCPPARIRAIDEEIGLPPERGLFVEGNHTLEGGMEMPWSDILQFPKRPTAVVCFG